MTYQNIDGWFNSHDYDIYKYLVDAMPDKSRFLEIGAYKGRSTVALAEIIAQSGKNITIDVIDTFKGDAHIGEVDTFDEFKANTAHIKNIGTVYRANSRDAHADIDPKTKYHAVFIDAAHDFNSVLADITNYLPFVAKNGHIAGHDYLHYDVADAVKAYFGDKYKTWDNCWYKRIEK